MGVNLDVKISNSCQDLFFLDYILFEYRKDNIEIVIKSSSIFSYDFEIKINGKRVFHIVDDGGDCDFPLVYSYQRMRNLINNYKNIAKKNLAIMYQIYGDKMNDLSKKAVEEVLDSL